MGTAGALIATAILLWKEFRDRQDAREQVARQVGLDHTEDYRGARWFITVTTIAPLTNCMIKAFAVEEGKEEMVEHAVEAILPPHREIYLPWPPPGTVTNVMFEFTDPNGQRWRRTTQGILTRLS